MTQKLSSVVYKERALPGVLFYLAALTLPISLFLVALPFSEVVSITLALASVPIFLAITWLGAPLITLTNSELRIGKVAIDRKFLASAEVIKPAMAFKERGSDLDSRAFTRFQIGIQDLVKIQIADEQDPTPYWLIATRNPEVLAGLINKG